ncbi:hypothetical protein, conserved [Plasmodium gonderi]|uniref:N6-adenine-specific methylase n=1 Tax=Plasmodium gonderi TaxID=77519 RepID=A0A1Y1JK77_PLAGO|nr:hypothetical protein, conserved [Plasmodium gonderi]GAW82068.1 hypothetical protein, conserved [Plasmodium gonderi]
MNLFTIVKLEFFLTLTCVFFFFSLQNEKIKISCKPCFKNKYIKNNNIYFNRTCTIICGRKKNVLYVDGCFYLCTKERRYLNLNWWKREKRIDHLKCIKKKNSTCWGKDEMGDQMGKIKKVEEEELEESNNLLNTQREEEEEEAEAEADIASDLLPKMDEVKGGKKKSIIKKDEYGIPEEKLNVRRQTNSKIKSKYKFLKVKTYNETMNINYRKKKILSIHEGKLKNKKIYSPDTYTRPMMSKVKESLFNILSHLGIFSNANINVLDVFSGSGNLGIECISRDLSHVTFVDLSLNSCKTIFENLKLCNIYHLYNKIIRADAMELLKYPFKFHIHEKFHLAFFTPPYEQIVYSDLIRNIAYSELFDQDCLIFIEYPKEIEMLPQRVYNMIGLRNRKFGRTYFALYVLNSSGKYISNERKEEFYPLHYNRKQRRQWKYL